MESYTTTKGRHLVLGGFVEAASFSEAGRLIAFEPRERKNNKNRGPLWYGCVRFETGPLAGDCEWEQCESLYPAPSPEQLARFVEETPRFVRD